MTIERRNEDIVREACQVIWSDGQVDRVGEFYAEDFVADYPNTDWGQGLEGIRKLASVVRSGMPDYSETIDLMISDGDYVVVELTISGTHTNPMYGVAPSGRKLSFRDVTILRLRDGKIVEQRGLTDHFSIFQQLGLLPQPDRAGAA